MGGKPFPKSIGINEGRIEGLKSPVHFDDYILIRDIKNIECPKGYNHRLFGNQYYIGFRIGYELGQKLRSSLKNDTNSQMPLGKKIECLSFLLEIQKSTCKENQTQPYINNIKYWNESLIPVPIAKDIQALLSENKIQRAIDKLLLYYKKNFYLKSLKEFYLFDQRLKNLRKEKKTNKKYDIAKELQKLKVELQNWVSIFKK
ncbi:hypothetical protein [Flavivirga algicola]|uniref:Uncharacterized protein n=1 Tax=Flavivirga algicola TaxID=2729136 RepID=A0ABX1RW91_9FLAO|nr:hypothetical protein [Flavivirga algicola]NMH87824.1 hypothetical protein [Flavivirga algicola]